MKKLVTHITSDENYYYLVKEIIIEEPRLFFFSKRIEYISYELLFKNKDLEVVKEFEAEIHKRFNFARTTKETIINQ